MMLFLFLLKHIFSHLFIKLRARN